MEAPCRLLPWDSAFFGFRIGEIIPERISKDEMEAVETWGAAEKIDCLYFLTEGEDVTSIRVAEEHGFHWADMRMELEKISTGAQSAENPAADSGIRTYQESDLGALQRSAQENHLHTRFFRDARFPREKAAELYAVWMGKNCRDPEVAVFVAHDGENPAGYISCRMRPNQSGQIVLAGVDPKQRGRGVGTRLIQKAEAWFRERGANFYDVVTQGTNIPALRLYTSNGFYPKRVQWRGHKWFSPPPRKPDLRRALDGA